MEYYFDVGFADGQRRRKTTGGFNTKYSTQYLYRKIIDVHIKKDLGFYRIGKLTSQILQDYLNKKFNDGYSKNYIISIKNLLSSSLRYAIKVSKYMKENADVLLEESEK